MYFRFDVRAFISPFGRLSRKNFIFSIFFVFLAIMLIYTASGLISGIGYILLTFLMKVVLIYLLFCICSKRMHDIGWSSLFCLVSLMIYPSAFGFSFLSVFFQNKSEISYFIGYVGEAMNVINMIFIVVLCLAPGQRGANRYGSNPLSTKVDAVF